MLPRNPGNCDMGNAARWARELFAHGWTIEDLAQRYGVPPAVITQMVTCRPYRGPNRRPRSSRAMSPDLKQRRAEERARQREKAKARERTRRWLPDPSDPEAWRWRDGGDDLVEIPAAVPPPVELVDQGGAAIPAAQLEPPAMLESWSGPVSPHASPGPRPRKVTAEVLAEALQLHAEGMSWPAIARKFGCHRMAFYHALRRPQP